MPKRKCSNIDLSVGQRLAKYRRECGLTQQQVADILNVNRTTYTKYETGASEPSHALLGIICKILGVDYNAVLGDNDLLAGALQDSDNDKLILNNLSRQECDLIANFRSLSEEDRQKVYDYVISIVIDRRNNFK